MITIFNLDEYDKESIIGDELFEKIFSIADNVTRSRLILECQDRAKQLGVKSNFDTLVSAYKQKLKESDRSAKYNPGSRVTDFKLPDDKRYKNMNCGSWVANHNGIVCYNVMGMELRASYQPVLPIERLENIETGEEQIVLAFYRDFRWKEITIAKDVISSSAKIVALSKYGLSVTSENAKHLVKYLNDVENLNTEDIGLLKSTSKLGWHGKDFIPYDKTIIFDGDIRFKSIFESITTEGHEDKWIDYVRGLRATGRPEIKFMLAASFASALIKPLGILPFFVDLWGETEGGKSVSLMLACSVWANPAESQYIGDFKTTDVALEAKADMLNNLPMMLDDTSKASAKVRDNFEGIVYDLCSGKGKSRSNKELGVNRENKWSLCILTNGEKSLDSYVNQGGAINRIIEIEASDHIYENPQETSIFLKDNYGWAGIRFVEEVKKVTNLRERYDEICKSLYDTDKMQKQAMSVACIMLADQIATETMFRDDAAITLEEAKEVLVDRSELSEPERCYQYICGKVAMNPQRFDVESNVEKWGFIEHGYVYFYPPAFADRCKEAGFSKKGFLSWAKKKELVLLDTNGNLRLKKIDGKVVRMIALKLDEMQEDFAEIEDDSTLPFD